MQVDASRRGVAMPQWRDSLERRVAAVHGLWQLGVADLTARQANHFERPGVLPIAFTLLHCVVGEDRNVARYLSGGDMLWDAQGWAKRVGLVGEPPQRGTPMADAERVRIADMDAWREYQSATFARTKRALAEMPLERFGAKAMDRPPADKLRGAFLGLLVPVEREILVADVCEAYIFQHAARHLGELEHARALVGLGGLS